MGLPFPYQHVGARFLAERRYGALFDEMGVGKSCEAILAADLIKAASVLVVAPNIALINWTREIAEWSPGSTASILRNDAISPARFMVVNYDLFSVPGRFIYQMRDARFDLMILDEVQAIKNHGAKRTQNILSSRGMARQAQRVWALSGTPCPNHPGELYALLVAMFPDPLRLADGAIMSYISFINRYCVVEDRPAPLPPKIIGARNMNSLREQLRPFALRRTLAEVLPELPPLRFSTVTLDPGDVLARIEADHPEIEIVRKLLVAAMEIKESEDDRNGVLANILLNEDSELPLATIRRLYGEAKAGLVAEWLTEELAFGGLDKVVVFFHHRQVATVLHSMLQGFGCALIHGDIPPTLRQAAIDNFQRAVACRVLLIQLDIGHRAITLTAAAHVVFAEASWTPTVNVQAARRCARLGQTRAVLARFMTLAGSLDEIIMRVVARKTAILAQLFPDFEETTDAADTH